LQAEPPPPPALEPPPPLPIPREKPPRGVSLVSAATQTAAAAHTPMAAAVPVLQLNVSAPSTKQRREASAAPEAEKRTARAAVSRSETASEPPPLCTNR
jgi:hypothetical protein